LDTSGTLRALHAETGELLGERPVAADGQVPTALSRWARDGRLALGLADGSIQTGTIRFVSKVRHVADEELDIPIGQSRPAAEADDSGFRPLIERVDAEQVRVTTPEVQLAAPVKVKLGEGAILRLDSFADGRKQFVVVLRESGPASYSFLRTTRPLGGGPPRTRLTTYPFELAPRDALQQVPPDQGGDQWGEHLARPDWLFVSGDGKHIYALWRDGTCQRYAVADPKNEPIVLAETAQLADSPITAAAMLIGSLTLVVGDAEGSVAGWFPAPSPTAPTPDQQHLVRGHLFPGPGGPVASLATSWRDRSVFITDTDGRAVVRHMASEKRVATLGASTPSPALAGAIAPKNDALAVLHEDGSIALARYEPGYPEITFGSLFAPMHYEGQASPSFVYQSSAGDDAAEPKLSLTPLIFGTLKATVVAMFFACPLAVFAAIYSSEFLSPGLRRTIKPAIEIMASLPSVVLGFIAAMVVAPLARDLLPGIMLAMLTVPLTILFAAGLWTTVPTQVRSRFKRKTQLLLVGLSLTVGIALALLAGPMIERTLFKPTTEDLLVLAGSYQPAAPEAIPAWVGIRDTLSPDDERHLRAEGLYFRQGVVVEPVEPGPGEWEAMQTALAEQGHDTPSIQRWLNGEIGTPWPGWFVALIPPGAILSLVLLARVFALLRRLAPADKSERLEIIIAIGQPFAALLLTCACAAIGALLLTAAGFDARDSIFGSFTPRNSLVVGVIMGFAIIPIIYSISEDALMSVPNTLRAASLGAGASPWQTAIRVVLPVAASGIFSASMIGLGRAVGETMIVLMATGNTPTMDLNIFEGFRTLAANIAVELPEAPKGEALYRVLFLCGLVLFLMTFVINTTAEVVRQHFRKKNSLL
ncbi:Phosphate transport system permease protein PstC (TC 3.A.1.7.1), partial [hydrothermal vent metagenome]